MTFASIPPRTVLSISYLFYGIFTIDQIVSYVHWEQGAAKRIPVMLQRIFPKWLIRIWWALVIAGIWVAVNAVVSLVEFLYLVYYARPQ